MDYVTLALRNLWTLRSQGVMEVGELRWNLGQSTPHDAGAVLDITFHIKNTTDTSKQYQIYFGLFELSGPVIHTWVWPEQFTVEGNSEASYILSQQINYSDCVLQASLYDPETGSMGATLETVLEQSSVPIEGGFGSLSWNLLEKTSYRTGEPLIITFKIRNPSSTDRQYQIRLGLFELGGAVINTWFLPDTVNLEAGKEISLTKSITLNYSNCVLQTSLYDVETGGMGAALQTTLEQPANIIEQISPALMGMMVIGMMVTFIPKVSKD